MAGRVRASGGFLADALGSVASSIEHIGSTAVPGLASKPTIDVLVVVDSVDAFLARLPQVEQMGFDYRPNNTLVGSGNHLVLREVTDGKRSHHVHVVEAGSPEIDDYRFFRDALRSDHSLATRYGRRIRLVRARSGSERDRRTDSPTRPRTRPLTAGRAR